MKLWFSVNEAIVNKNDNDKKLVYAKKHTKMSLEFVKMKN